MGIKKIASVLTDVYYLESVYEYERLGVASLISTFGDIFSSDFERVGSEHFE